MLATLNTRWQKTLAILAALLMIVGFAGIVAVNQAQKAEAVWMFTNSSSGGHNYIDVRSDYGHTVTLWPGQSARNISHVYVRQGQCIRIQNRGTVCSTRGTIWVSLGGDAQWGIRTR